MSDAQCPKCGTSYPPPARFCIKDGFPLVTGAVTAPSLHRPDETRRPGTRSTDPAGRLEGQVIDGRYVVEARVGEGGMAYVYRATDRQTAQVVAIKVLMAKLAGDPESVARLKREAHLAMKLIHPNTCGLLSYGEADHLPYLVMPYLEGETLSTRENRIGTMAPRQAVPILIQLCHGLQHAHDQGVMHRDLKPENVMLVPSDQGERAVVMDFGLAKERIAGAELNPLTATGIVLGTPEFMSPEQIRGRTIDHRSDIYALGVLAFELLSGELPYAGATAQETMLNHLTGKPKRLASVVPAIPPALDQVIDRALKLEPKDRFQSMTEFAGALSRIPL